MQNDTAGATALRLDTPAGIDVDAAADMRDLHEWLATKCFAGKSMGTGGKLIWIIHNANDSGYRE